MIEKDVKDNAGRLDRGKRTENVSWERPEETGVTGGWGGGRPCRAGGSGEEEKASAEAIERKR